MSPECPRAWGQPPGRAVLRTYPEDFTVEEQLGFEPEGQGEHAFLWLEKRLLNTAELAQRVSSASGIGLRDISYAGLKDRRAVTRQWLSVRMAGRPEPDWAALEDDGHVKVLAAVRHRKKLKRGVHRGNRFELTLRQLDGSQEALDSRLEQIKRAGVPNYFGEQRFGRNQSTLRQAEEWAAGGGRRIGRTRRSLYLSALRAQAFNTLLAARVEAGDWAQPLAGDACMLAGTRSVFRCQVLDADLQQRAEQGDVHPALPLWGRGDPVASPEQHSAQLAALHALGATCEFLEAQGLELAYRATRTYPHDFYWQFCDDERLILQFSLGTGCYATAVLAELVDYKDGDTGSGSGSE